MLRRSSMKRTLTFYYVLSKKKRKKIAKEKDIDFSI